MQVQARNRWCCVLSGVAMILTIPCPPHAQDLAANPPDLNSILDSLERTEAQDPAFFKPHEVMREYKLFRNNDPKPTSDVTARINFAPPDVKTFTIIDAQGSPRGKK